MANWLRTLDIKNEWKLAKKHELSPQELATIVAKRLREMRPHGIPDVDDVRAGLIEEFEAFAADEYLDNDDFDELWERLYDWADGRLPQGRVCWVVIC